jgi:hypothetical protein
MPRFRSQERGQFDVGVGSPRGEPMASGTMAPTFRKPRKMGQPRSWWRILCSGLGSVVVASPRACPERNRRVSQRRRDLGHPAPNRAKSKSQAAHNLESHPLQRTQRMGHPAKGGAASLVPAQRRANPQGGSQLGIPPFAKSAKDGPPGFFRARSDEGI